ncbi:peptide-methionine (S)-S-oxide reductase MsrA [Alkalicoccus halolimnae]|uniref:Peptide methionine sulfoxide reductase MsrA n=1 Tax=Alkalicoccus halolimnae TaxID=1667239 RepID=A0A5C7FAN8_9BACI|nr:peptide-methionine (S)-S-oxide reductase MsrA [Alkalicoccus halolimnae]TXF87203.1 peptide-methionine (S)-S-oxide reductase MsrA [Alkalicoccus halolimnae]
MNEQVEIATFAGGCFWCMVKPFDEQPGILRVRSGYTGGLFANPSYEQVKTGETGHFEAVQITYDASLYSYEQLLDLFWTQIDPTDDGGQFFDRGSQYRSAIFYHNENQMQAALKTRHHMETYGPFQKPIVTQILPASEFYEAEYEHQKFHEKNPDLYRAERINSGREAFLKRHWTERMSSCE